MTKILLVEDDVNLREIFQMRLIAEGYDTVSADNGEEGLVVAMKERPDLIISDVMMPKLSGFEMLETLRAAPEMANTKAVMMTALGQAEDRARGEKLGVVKYLVKSQVTLEDFVSVVREVVSPGPTGGTAAAAVSETSQVQTNQPKESEAPMPPADQSTNPAPASDDSGANNPISGVPADTAQQSTEQEQTAVQDQINSFVNSGDDTAATSAPTDGAAAAAPTDGGSTAGDSGSAFGGEPAAPAGGDGMATPTDDSGATPAADITAPEPPASTEPPADSPQPPASTGTL